MKKQLFILAATAAILALAPGMARAQKQPVYVDCQAREDNDLVGARLCTAVRNKLAYSPRYELVGADATRRWTLHILSMTVEFPGYKNIGASTQSVTLTAYNSAKEDLEVYLNQYIFLIGEDRVSTMADQVVANIDGDISTILKN